jgi:hypothetical protein
MPESVSCRTFEAELGLEKSHEGNRFQDHVGKSVPKPPPVDPGAVHNRPLALR